MGLFDFLRPAKQTSAHGVPVTFEPTFMFTADEVADFVSGVGKLSPEKIYEKNDNLRTVLDFRARNFSQIGMHSYQRDPEEGRQRDRGSNAATLLARPAPGLTWFELMWAVCLDYDLHARTFLVYHSRANAIVHVPSRRVRLVSGSWELGDFVAEIQPAQQGADPVRVDARSLIPFLVYNPGGKSPMEALKETLKEQAAASAFRMASWKNGHQTNRYIWRPKDAPDWTPEGRERFLEQMRRFRAGGGERGGAPLLEDGMEMRSDQFKAVEDQVVEMAKLSREKCAAAYGVTLSMLGSADGVTYANLKEYRRQLYGETLGPVFKMVEDRLNAFLLPLTDPGREDLYLEFNVKERMKADPVEQAQMYQASVGAPIMTRNEARARENMPAVDGGDELITPLNVALGTVASPQDTAPDKPGYGGGSGALSAVSSGESADDLLKRINAAAALIRSGFAPQAALEAVGLDSVEHLGLLPVTVQRPQDPENVDEEIVDQITEDGERSAPALHMPRRPALVKAPRATSLFVDHYEADVARVQDVLSSFFERLARSVLSDLGAGREPSYDRWQEELYSDLQSVMPEMTRRQTLEMLDALGVAEADFDPLRSHSIDALVSDHSRNIITSAVTAAMRDEDAEHALEVAAGRARSYAETIVGSTHNRRAIDVALAGVRGTEGEAMKQWVTTSSNPRPTHAAMNGELVKIGDPFSNGAMFPRQSTLGPADVANCQCQMTVTIQPGA